MIYERKIHGENVTTMHILAIDTSCDETSAAIVDDRKVLSHLEYSQILAHKEWGGVVPSIAKRAHQERIDWVIETVLKNAHCSKDKIDAVAVTYGPGLAIALEVGILKAKELARNLHIPLIPINHMEGHLYSPFVQNGKGNPKREFEFPYVGLLVSGGHTELVKFTDHLTYEILGETRDDAAGEALDKAAKMLGFSYPGGPILERLAHNVDNSDTYHFPRPMIGSKNYEFSFSGLKTAFLYKVRGLSEVQKNKEIENLASAFQEAVFSTLLKKTERAIKQLGINRLIVGGGVAVNKRLRFVLREMVKKQNGKVLFPSYTYLNFDNAAMIGLVASIRLEKKVVVTDIDSVDRIPRLSLLQSSLS